jgi:hypothetical protein
MDRRPAPAGFGNDADDHEPVGSRKSAGTGECSFVDTCYGDIRDLDSRNSAAYIDFDASCIYGYYCHFYACSAEIGC